LEDEKQEKGRGFTGNIERKERKKVPKAKLSKILFLNGTLSF
jgi:hypothetical protein